MTSMRGMFKHPTSFNLRGMSIMQQTWDIFHGATSFNQPLNSWDVSYVANMSEMFYCATHSANHDKKKSSIFFVLFLGVFTVTPALH
jgi:hypothetical protein